MFLIKENYDALVSIFLKHGNSFKGIKKVMFILEEEIEVNDNNYIKKEVNEEYLKRDYLINELKKIDFDKWNEEYLPLEKSLDYDEWSLTFSLNNYEKIIFRGLNNYPSDFNKLIELINKYSNLFLKEEN